MKSLKVLTSFILIFLLSSWASAQAHCDQLIGTCEYYLCLESHYNCGEKGYFINFGHHYCEKYNKKTKKFSENGQVFLSHIRLCLQQKLNTELDHIDCSNVKSVSIKTHEECYKEFQYCELKITDRLKVQWIAKKEIFDPEFSNFASYLNDLCYPKK